MKSCQWRDRAAGGGDATGGQWLPYHRPLLSHSFGRAASRLSSTDRFHISPRCLQCTSLAATLTQCWVSSQVRPPSTGLQRVVPQHAKISHLPQACSHISCTRQIQDQDQPLATVYENLSNGDGPSRANFAGKRRKACCCKNKRPAGRATGKSCKRRSWRSSDRWSRRLATLRGHSRSFECVSTAREKVAKGWPPYLIATTSTATLESVRTRLVIPTQMDGTAAIGCAHVYFVFACMREAASTCSFCKPF